MLKHHHAFIALYASSIAPSGLGAGGGEIPPKLISRPFSCAVLPILLKLLQWPVTFSLPARLFDYYQLKKKKPELHVPASPKAPWIAILRDLSWLASNQTEALPSRNNKFCRRPHVNNGYYTKNKLSPFRFEGHFQIIDEAN